MRQATHNRTGSISLQTSPIFLFSLPRSGSTLLQRMLACHSEIKTSSELWFLLPHIDAVRNRYSYSQFSYLSLRNATRDLIEQLPAGEDSYFSSIRLMADDIYRNLAINNERYVLDKTPRYYLVLEEILKIYPDAKFIFLLRNPLSVAASIVESFNRGRLGDFRHRIDLYLGPGLLASGCEVMHDYSINVHFEELLRNTRPTLEKICSYLDIEFEGDMLNGFSKVPVASLGDQFGSREFTTIQANRIENWKQVFATSYRKKYLLKYMREIGEETFSRLGYDFDGLTEEVMSMDVAYSPGFRDRYDLARCSMWSVFEGMVFRDKLRRCRNGKNRQYLLH